MRILRRDPRDLSACQRLRGRAVESANVGETAVKLSLKRVVTDPSALREAAEGDGFSLLPIEARHCSAVARLPRHHSDQFDRPLVAQALVEPMRLLTHDSQLARHSDTVAVVRTMRAIWTTYFADLPFGQYCSTFFSTSIGMFTSRPPGPG